MKTSGATPSSFADARPAIADTPSFRPVATGTDEIAIGAEIVLWVAPTIKGLDSERVWQAEQGGRRILDYEQQASDDRTLIGIMVPLATFLIFVGLWLILRYDWQGNPVE